MPRDGSLDLVRHSRADAGNRLRAVQAGALPRDSIIPPTKPTPEHD
jgi:hypothetical protein